MSTTREDLERREFLQRLTLAGLSIAITGTGCWRQERGAAPAGTMAASDGADPAAFSPSVYLHIAPDSTVTIVCHRSEMGQGIRTSLAMALADELEADWSKVKLDQADGDEQKYGDQNTDGSGSIRGFFTPFRQAGALARTLLEQAAAKQWGVSATEIETRNGIVSHGKSGRTSAFGSLVAQARTLPAPKVDDLRLKPRAEWRLIGKDIGGLDISALTTGRTIYGQDLRHDGMKVAVIAHPPVYGGTIAALDSADAEKVPGVERVIRLETPELPSSFLPLGGVAVVARNSWAAIEGRRKLKVTWNDGPNGSYDSASYRHELEHSVRRPGQVARNQGNVAAAFSGAAKHLSAEYYVPHLAHASMEPPAALAIVKDGACEAWACVQAPQGAREAVAKVLKLPVEKVTVHVTFLGGGFGRKSMPDYVAEAAVLSREMGAPVKVIWTREDDLQHDYFHSVTLEHMEGGLDAQGRVVAWLHRSAMPPIASTFEPDKLYQGDGDTGQGMTDFPWAIPNYRAEVGPARAHTRIGWYRSVSNIPHAFAIGSFLDELAHAAGKDPREFLLQTLGPDRVVDLSKSGLTSKPWNYGEPLDVHPIDTSRYRRTLEMVADQSGWGSPLPAGSGRGIAVHRSFVTYTAAVVRVDVRPDGSLRIPRVDIVMDAGTVVNPERVRAQMEGAVVMGIGNALHSEISFKNGRVVQSNLTDYRVARMESAPREIHATIVQSDAPPGGVGEPGVPPVAPALCNAIFAATGRRIRDLPVTAAKLTQAQA